MKIYKIILRVISIFLLIGGISLFILAGYITSEVDKGRKKADSAQHDVDTARSITSSNALTKDIGEAATQPFQKKIDKGRRDIRKYEGIVTTLNVIAISVTSAAPVLFITSFFPKAKPKPGRNRKK